MKATQIIHEEINDSIDKIVQTILKIQDEIPETEEETTGGMAEPTDNAKESDHYETEDLEQIPEATEADGTSEDEKEIPGIESSGTPGTEEITEAAETPGTEIIITPEPDEIQETTEMTVAPDPIPVEQGKTNGNWGTVVLIIFLIAAIGAAMAVFLTKRKKTEKKADEKWSSIPETEGSNSPTKRMLSCGMAQTIGKRSEQQDSLYCSNWKDPNALLVRGLIAVVSDGIGGLKDGNIASQNAVQAIRSAFLQGNPGFAAPDRLLACAAAAQKSVLKVNESTNAGATLVSVLITGRELHFLSIGDSRIYLYRAGALLQLNREHVLRRQNDEMEHFYGTGEKLTAKRAGALTSYLGKDNLTLIDRSLQPVKLMPGDKIALMSDGVFNTLSETEIMAHLLKTPEAAANDMIRDVEAHANPVQDNASIVVIGIE